jgi:hypothetical protein
VGAVGFCAEHHDRVKFLQAKTVVYHVALFVSGHVSMVTLSNADAHWRGACSLARAAKQLQALIVAGTIMYFKLESLRVYRADL